MASKKPSKKAQVQNPKPQITYDERLEWNGVKFKIPVTEFDACLKVFNHIDKLPQWQLSKVDTFWRFCELVWPKKQGAFLYVERNPWAELIVERLCEKKFLGISGCASCGKSFLAGSAWTLFQWLCDPANTTIFVTSTDVKGSRRRVWKDISRLFQGFLGIGLDKVNPAIKLLDATAQIKLDKKLLGSGVVVAGGGIEIAAGEASAAKETCAKLQGAKAPRVILVMDELPDLAHSIVETGLGNLISNPHCQLIALGNFGSIYDPFGVFTEPKDGWKTITENSYEWETKIGGWCIRFDGEQSPNVLAGQNLYDRLYSIETYQQHLKLGRNSPAYWRMCRSLPQPEGGSLSIYSENDMVTGNVHDHCVWDDEPIRVAFLDPAFTNGGDRCQAVAAEVGDSNGKRRISFIAEEELVSDVTSTLPHDYQIASLYKGFCQRHGVRPDHAGFDGTGSGLSFGSILFMEWSPAVLPVMFGGGASDLPVSIADQTPCKEVYADQITELWIQFREYVRSDQVRGLSKAAARELLARQFPDPEMTRRTAKRARIESKTEMKKRLKCSPDLADAHIGAIQTARIRLNFTAEGYGVTLEAIKEERFESQTMVDDLFDDSCLSQEQEYYDNMLN